ncbi:hypothetical protein ACOKGD_07175 [Microbacterium phosphatis]|uniref:hypothetical protein n=1 Tax=Microbacterium phosphatis TaxID=3140248 RepID=UPI0031409978
MSDVDTMVRTEVAVNGVGSFLAQGQDLDDLKARIEDAMQAGGRFVDFTVVGNRAVSVLITATAQVVFSVETVPFDPRDTGDQLQPYGAPYDF